MITKFTTAELRILHASVSSPLIREKIQTILLNRERVRVQPNNGRPKNPLIPEGVQKNMIQRYTSGESMQSIAKAWDGSVHVKITYDSVRKVLLANGVKMRKPGRPKT